MCGFAGELRPGGPPDQDALARMSASLTPRGPDGEGTWVHDGLGLVHRRLAVIDLSAHGAQPMVQGDLAVAFNGCIYNHRELRAELERAHGARFASTSDTEVLLHGWAAWGAGLLDRLKGMFAFALWDGRAGRLVLARDRLGVKPLYLAELPDGTLRFASTLPAILAGGGVDTDVDPIALHHYLSLHSIVPPPRTILRGVRKLEPATVLTVDRSASVVARRRYWEPPFARSAGDEDLTAADWADALRDALSTAVERRMVADVPVGVLLSGGLDSSIIVALLAEQGQQGLQTFSVGFGDAGGREGNEFRYSRLVAERFGTEHHTFEVGVDRLLDALPQAIGAMSEPMVSHDTVAFWLLSQEVSRHLKVVQSGQGADEVLGGYYWYPPMLEATGTGVDAYCAAFLDRPDAEVDALLGDGWALQDDPTRRLVQRWFDRPGAATPVDRALRIDTEVMLVDDPVKRVDTMTMAHGLEARTPFLDHELVELAARCPPEVKLAQGGKGVLKDAARGLVPDAVIDREKGYFPVPALSHLEEPVLTMVREALHAPAAVQRGLFSRPVVERMLADPNAHRTNLDGSTLWQLALLELWLQHHVG